MDQELEIVSTDGRIQNVTFCPDGPDDNDDENRGYDPDMYDPDDERLASLPGSKLRRLIDSVEGESIAGLSTNCPVSWEGNHGSYGSHASFMKQLLRRDRPSLRALELDGQMLPVSLAHGGARPELSFLQRGISGPAVLDVGDLSKLWKIAPGLEHLVIAQAAKVKLGAIESPTLRTLLFGCSARAHLGAIASASLPALETLIVRVARAADAAALLANASLGEIRHLGLIADHTKPNKQGDKLIAALIDSPRLPHLVTLDLGGFHASPASWRSLIAAAPRLRGLTELRISSWKVSRDELADIEEELLDDLAPFFSDRCRPRDGAIGRALEQAFPIRWLTNTIEELEEEVVGISGFSSNLSLDDWIEVERRSQP